MSNQVVKIPRILNCTICNAPASVIDWNYNMKYKVMCDNNHSLKGECCTINRAIRRWNNEQLRKLSKEKQ